MLDAARIRGAMVHARVRAATRDSERSSTQVATRAAPTLRNAARPQAGIGNQAVLRRHALLQRTCASCDERATMFASLQRMSADEAIDEEDENAHPVARKCAACTDRDDARGSPAAQVAGVLGSGGGRPLQSATRRAIR